LEAFCEDAKLKVDEAVQGISRLNQITDLHEMFNVSRYILVFTCTTLC